VSPLLTALRPKQWAKNLFVLAPLVFAHRLTDTVALGRGLLAFAAFCAAASAVYLLNDLVDRDEDRRHPLKRRRPIASGALAAPLAIAIAVALVGLAALAASRIGASFAGWLGGYLALNMGYTWWLKRVVILDVMTIAMGFVVRVLAGAAAAAVPVSSWLLLCTTFLSLFLAFSKRRHELGLLQGAAADQRQVLSNYSPAFLDQMINVVTASAVVSYALYAVAPETVAKYGGEQLIFTIPMVLFGIFRYLFLIYQRTAEKNPTETILGDAPFLINLAVWALAVVWIVYRSGPVRA
jgi:4-hydroxybenzoate polyprenyltransferase